MAFSFGFSGDDIESEEAEGHDASLANGLSETTISGLELHSNAHTVQPKRHTLAELLASLPSQISYNTVIVATNTTPDEHAQTPQDSGTHTQPPEKNATEIYRRSLFDIRAQLMAESDPSSPSHAPDSAGNLLVGLENGDLSSGIYEGGFKTWECALDLASLLICQDFSPLLSTRNVEQTPNWEVIELGAGSAVPSLAVLRPFLHGTQHLDSPSKLRGSLKLTLCDYNEDVLRLGTAPNVFLNSLSTISSSPAEDAEGELDIEELGAERFITATMTNLVSHNISIDFISGGWGDDFVEVLRHSQPSRPQDQQPTNLLILASETIYSPSSTKVFSQILMSILSSHRDRHPKSQARAWIAAKKVYFGVGGGVDEFVREIERLGGISRVIFESQGTGVGRVVVEVMAVGECEEF